MGLVFTVGAPSAAFEELFDSAVQSALQKQFGRSLMLDSQEEPYWSEEVALSWWGQFQRRAHSLLGTESTSHLRAVDAWMGVYLPISIAPQAIPVAGSSTPLQCASLPQLVQELERFGEAMEPPVDETGLHELAAGYLEDDNLIDEDGDIQTYAQLLLAAREATARNQPLWIVK